MARQLGGSTRVVARDKEWAEKPKRSTTESNPSVRRHAPRTWAHAPLVRTPKTSERSSVNLEWVLPLEEIAAQKVGRATTHNLASLMVTHVRAEEILRMLVLKEPNLAQNRTRAIGLQRELGGRIGKFVRLEGQNAYDRTTDDARLAHDSDKWWLAGHKLLEDEAYVSEIRHVAPEPFCDIEAHTDSAFSEAEFAVTDIRWFEGQGYGLDLTSNDQLYEEHETILRYLRVEERLDTRALQNANWEAQAPVYVPRDLTLNAPPLDFDHPDYITLRTPHVL